MRIKATRLFGVLLVAFLLAVPASAQSVRGKVMDAETGQGIPGVLVTLVKASGARVFQVTTNADGGFQMPARESGEYRIQTSHIAYASLPSVPFRIQANEQVMVDVKLATA